MTYSFARALVIIDFSEIVIYPLDGSSHLRQDPSRPLLPPSLPIFPCCSTTAGEGLGRRGHGTAGERQYLGGAAPAAMMVARTVPVRCNINEKIIL